MAAQARLGGTSKGSSLEEAKARAASRTASRAAAEAEGARAAGQLAARAKGPLPQSAADLQTETTGHLLATLQMKLKELDDEVKDDERGAEELRRHLKRLQQEHAEIKKARDRAAALVEGYEAGSMTFDKEYSKLMDSSDETYKMVRTKHKEAIGILEKEDTFAYHPAYKRPTDKFEAAYFTPTPLKKAEEKKSPAQIKLERMRKQGTLSQVGSNAVGAASSSVRP
ncbi:unnamed protein product, partial [Symbiodinium necroappetens]